MWKPRGKLQFCMLALALVLIVLELYNVVVARYPRVGSGFKDFKLPDVGRFSTGNASDSRGWLDRFQTFASGKGASDKALAGGGGGGGKERGGGGGAAREWGRYVHLDLKGAPPRSDYLLELIPLLSRLKATGLLVEYEDTFPYTEAQGVAAGTAYTRAELERVLAGANKSRLDVIPLVQTFGHMEFVLKLRNYKHLRESERYPQAICPSHPESLPLIYGMIDEVMSVHREAKHIHLGCDEVFTLGVCPRCLARMAQHGWTKKQLFLDHVSTVARYVRNKYPGTTPLIWDDELRELGVEELEGVGALVEPVVWKYTPDVGRRLPAEMWAHYALVFDNVWIATAFKGAHQANSLTTLTSYYFENHEGWMEVVGGLKGKVSLAGAIMTGWQRYDHFAVLCELLPVAIPSLALNLAYLAGSTASYRALGEAVSKKLGCEGGDPLAGGAQCSFPGAQVFSVVSSLPSLLYRVSLIKQESTYKGWLSDYNIDYSFSSPMQVEEAVSELDRLRGELAYLERRAIEGMQEVYDNYTIAEWLYTYVKPTRDELEVLSKASRAILDKTEWPRRPLPLDLSLLDLH